ncbi:unnamed protein product [Orchesella dallaii]|uniref:Uncharacterized protein n=1 Tax=Orchesella dallaii TaxID=48710 RepID=A0ABP1RDS6_9HEXA
MYPFAKISVGILISLVLLVAVSECTKYTSKELEDLRKFYYDDDPLPEADKEEKEKPRQQSPRPESRSSKPAKKKNSSKEDEDDTVIGPGELIKDARKYLNAGRKTLDKEAQRILPRILFRPIRSSDKKGKADEDEDSLEYYADSENDDEEETTTTTTQKPKRTRTTRMPFSKDKKSTSTTERNSFLEPFQRISDDWLNYARDGGGLILKHLNTLRPSTGFPLPTLPVPNLEDFGG